MFKIKRQRGLYLKEQLVAAINAVKAGNMPSVKASRVYGVPQSTIRSRINNPELRIGADRQYYLTRDEEKCLIRLIKSVEKINVCLTKALLKRIAGEYTKSVTNDQRLKSK